MFECGLCPAVFEKFQSRSNHIRWHHRRDIHDTAEFRANLKKSTEKRLNNRFGDLNIETVKCDNINGCLNKVEIKYRTNKPKLSYCSRSCANSRKWTEDRHIKHKERLNNPNDSYGNGFIEQQFSTEKQRIMFSSKNERMIVDYFKSNFKDDIWKSGGRLQFKGLNIVRDMWSDKLKICFEYDGIWHFKDIHNQLTDKQIKDTALEEWCLLNDYRLIRIDEDVFKNINQIEQLIYNDTRQIIKEGIRY